MSKALEAAKAIKEACEELGWTYDVRGTILTICKQFTPGSKEEFVTADMEYYGILDKLKSTSPGSIWGTDGSGIGAISAMNSGVFKMNKSGGSKPILKKLAELA